MISLVTKALRAGALAALAVSMISFQVSGISLKVFLDLARKGEEDLEADREEA
jgi:hypothetical protein